ncbi:hypothetical protein [Orrella marina]|uniref:Uncharacterized protein n=1 Tax=Orrella marina TaxID=2163011 RepID=A0A2R4XF73_9BURK|nr:hypothetical protein [Orrella marina]AWB32466.1 hypothetical protein DBV39_00650 [Orrella marina]
MNIAQNENKCNITFLGTYVINNTFNFNINPNNSEVHFKDSLIHLKPNANFSANVSGNSSGLKITPRKSGDGSYGGIAIWMSGQNSGFLMNQPNAYVSIGGLVYAPNSSLKIQMSGNGGGNKEDPVSFSGIIANSVNFTNNAQNGDPFIVNPPPSGVCDTGGSSGNNPNIGSPDKTKLVG